MIDRMLPLFPQQEFKRTNMKATPSWFATKFKLDELLIKRYEFWTWSLRPAQCTLGASVLSLNREAEAWGAVTPDENQELSIVIAEIETRLSTAFAYDKINYLMLMMVDPHVHFHIIPRYCQSKSLLSEEWKDPNWPKPPDLGIGSSDSTLLKKVLNHINSV